jgi:lipopolysaccharide export system protein LptA
LSTPVLTRTYLTGGAITKRRIVKWGSADHTVVQATAATDSLIGVAAELDAASGERIDVHLSGVVEVEFGGNVTRGAQITADTSGKAVAAAPAAGVNNGIIGIAMVSGVSGDIGTVLLAQSTLQGA